MCASKGANKGADADRASAPAPPPPERTWHPSQTGSQLGLEDSSQEPGFEDSHATKLGCLILYLPEQEGLIRIMPGRPHFGQDTLADDPPPDKNAADLAKAVDEAGMPSNTDEGHGLGAVAQVEESHSKTNMPQGDSTNVPDKSGKGKGRPPEPVKAETAEPCEMFVPEQGPPPKLSAGAIDKRLRRIMAPRTNGTHKVPDEVLRQWKDLDQRGQVRNAFEKVGYKPDWFLLCDCL